jgi:transposase
MAGQNMDRFIKGEDRTQSTLFPERLDDYVAEESAVRVIDVFIDNLDLSGLGFRTESKETGRPAYHPSTMLKIYVYGYLNRVPSCRRLEREAGRNVELMWLTGRLAPDYKTIADFRKDNGKAIRLVCREFVVLCRKLNLFTDAFVAIDGSKFKAVNNWDRNFTKAKIRRRIEEIDASIERYLDQITNVDRQESSASQDASENLESKIDRLKEEMAHLGKLELEVLAAPDQQISMTDPDARAMATSGRGTGKVGYNVQTAVDTKHHLIVAHEVTNTGHDRAQLANMAEQAKDTIDTDHLTVVADRGYFSGDEILACEESGITTIVPKPQTSSNRAKGQFDRSAFVYIPEDDEYRCPANERLIYRFTGIERGKNIRRYWASGCARCSIKSQCTSGIYRRIGRWEHESVLEAVQARLDREPEHMQVRRNTVEHPFGTIKSWMGSTHFQMRTLKHVSTEMSLHVLAYNMKRLMTILGIGPLIAAIQT